MQSRLAVLERLGLNEYRKNPEMYGGTCRVNPKQPYSETAFLNPQSWGIRGARPYALAIGADRLKETAGTAEAAAQQAAEKLDIGHGFAWRSASSAAIIGSFSSRRL